MSSRRGFSLVEVLVALTVLALAVAALATTLSADRRLRLAAQAQDAFALRVRDRVERFAAHCGGRDTSGAAAGAWGTERWWGVAGAETWTLVDSLRSPAGRVAVDVQAVIPCRP